jgi:hypothetical protein
LAAKSQTGGPLRGERANSIRAAPERQKPNDQNV